ncbi:MAG: phosphoenolpyruvate carboxykinase domain-containing protein, partial [Saccharolobus sp.]
YFLKDGDKFLNSKEDKRVWVKWAVKRVENSVDAIYTPIGLIPYYEDLKVLFSKILNKDYSERDYEKQFTLKLGKYLEKTERIIKIYSSIDDVDEEVINELMEQKRRIMEYMKEYGESVSPFVLAKK